MNSIFLKSLTYFVCAGISILAFSACSTVYEDRDFKPGKDDVLTPAEQKLMIENARQAIIAACKEKKLPPSVEEQVKTREPEVEVYYFNKKYGFMRLRWKLPRTADIIMTLKGALLIEKPHWRMIRVTQSDSALEKTRRKEKIEKSSGK